MIYRALASLLIFIGATMSANAQSVNMADYWPSPAVGEQLLVQDATLAYGPEVLSVLHRYRVGAPIGGKAVTQLDDYITTTGWLDAWFLYKNGPSIIEIANTFPVNKRNIYKVGKEITWGATMNVGDVTQGSIEIDLTKSTGIVAGPSNYGWQRITYEAFLPTFTNDGGLAFTNVVRMRVFQSWCKTNACDYPAGQSSYEMTYWMAPGLGMIQIDYISPTVRRDYAKSVTRTALIP